MKYALVLEYDPAACNSTATLLSSMGYLTTPVFSPGKALHAAHMIQFDLIVTCTAVNPGDRRALTGELARCSPEAMIVLLADPATGVSADARIDGVSAIVYRPFSAQDLQDAVERGSEFPGPRPPPVAPRRERRRRAID